MENEQKRKRAIVTGAAGFIGHNLVKELIAQGWWVFGIDNLVTGQESRLTSLDVLWYGNSVEYINDHYETSVVELVRDFGEFDAIFHLAAIPRVPISFEKPKESLQNNINSTIAALELARKLKCPIVYSSSSSVYGDQKEMPLNELMEPSPQSPYAYSKLAGEELCEMYAVCFGVRAVSLRYFNVYGPGMTKGGYATAISTFIEQRKNGQPLTVTGDGNQERDFTHVSDVVRANILAFERMMKPTITMSLHEIINIGAGIPRRINDVAAMIGDKIEYITARREPKKTHASNLRAYTLLNWKPEADFVTEIKNLIQTEL